jgi:hypothetical protein
MSSDGQAILFGETLDFSDGEFYTLQALPIVKHAPPWTTVVGPAYRLSASPNAPGLTSTSLNLGYLASEVPPGEEQWLQVYFGDGNTWRPLPTILDTYYNLATVRVPGPGVFALMSGLAVPLEGPGWNLFGYPVPGARGVVTALQSISGNYTTVYGYDVGERSDPYDRWQVYDVAAPDWVNDLVELEFSHGYWINITPSAPITLWLKGASATAQAAIASVPYPPATYYGPVLASPGFTPTVGTLVTALVNGQVCGQTRTKTVDGQLVYVVHVIFDGPGQAAGCGLPGRAVTFEVGDRVMAMTATWDNNRVWTLPLSTVPLRHFRLPLIEKGH